MSADLDELESYWEDFAAAKRGPILVVSGKTGDVKGAMELAAARAINDVAKRYPIAGETPFVREGIETFSTFWKNDLLSRGSGGLVELVLEDSKLTLEELKAFLRALPATLVRRIVDAGAASESAKGIHALMSIEHLWRTRREAFRRDYSLSRDETETLTVTVYPNRGTDASSVSFRLDETFDLSRV